MTDPCTCSRCRGERHDLQAYVTERKDKCFWARFYVIDAEGEIPLEKVSEDSLHLVEPGAYFEALPDDTLLFCRAVWTAEEIEEIEMRAKEYEAFFQAEDRS